MDCSNMEVYLSHSVKETEDIGYALGKTLCPGDIVAYKGGMGMGKTQMTRGIVRAFGDETQVSSPTFSIVNHYHTNPPIFHFDMYRITSEEDLYSTGFYEYMDRNGIILIEWSENIEEELPEGCITVSFTYSGENERTITVKRGGI